MTTSILLVEDNPITRKLVRFTLETQGLRVTDAPDGKTALAEFANHAPALVVQDIVLPDMDGFELLKLLRELPGGTEVPILVFSGMLSPHDEARVASAGFDDLISKPVEPSRLLQIVRSHLPSEHAPLTERFGQGRRIVVADDDGVQRKLVGFRMQRAGFEVFSAADGRQALELVRQAQPHAVVSDVLMPVLDGFGLCLEMRKDPTFAKIPVVLTTSSYVEPTDRELAQRVGARDLVLRTPELTEVLAALRTSLRSSLPPKRVEEPSADLEADHMRRMMRQLERQVTLNAGANQRCALLSAELSVITGISEALAGHEDIDTALRHTLAACFDAGGISLGALYLTDERGFRVLSFGFSRDWTDGELLEFFGERDLLDASIRSTSVVLLSKKSSAQAQRVLEKAAAASALLVPLHHKGTAFGALLMVSRNGELESEDRGKFAEAVASQISQALALAVAFREKENSERVAREQASLLRSILESIGDAVVVVDDTGKFMDWNPAAKPIVKMGVAHDEGGGKSSVFGIYDSDKSTLMPVDRLPHVRAMRGEAVDGMELFVRHSGAPEGVWLSGSARPWRDEKGASHGGVAVFRDVTQEKQTQSQLMASDRMATMGMLAAGVAHEINNPLAAVLANLDLAWRDLLDRKASDHIGNIDELQEMLDDARTAADRVRQIARDLKVFSRHEEARTGAVDAEKVIESSLRMAWNTIRHRGRLIKDYGRVGLVEGSESRLGQVFLNLIVNAAQALPEGDVEANSIRIVTRPADPERVAIEVSDTGSGISEENLRHLFTPFFTTKGPGVGTGLGLAICQRIISGFGGEIQVESELGKGTTFRVLLPVAELPAQPREDSPPPSVSSPARRARLLVIDDEPMITTVVRRTLGKEHDVTTVASARDGLALIRSGERFDIVLCDLMMPQMTGMELYGELHALDETLADRVIFLTGGAFTPSARAFLDRVPNQRIEKPFDAQHLRMLINDRIK